MPQLLFNIIGAGRLGKALACALIHHQQAQLVSVCNSRLSSAQTAVEQLGTGQAVASLTALGPAHILFITAPDDQIPTIVSALAQSGLPRPNLVVIHCSGVLRAEVLAPLARLGCHTASLHPLKPFTEGLPNSSLFDGCYCALEGSLEARTLVSRLFEALGAKIVTIQSDKKAAYHTAAVMVSNYLVTLADKSNALFQMAGMDNKTARAVIQQLMQSSLNNINQAEILKDALTGPLSRGDAKTIALHLDNITEPLTKQLYCALAQATLPLTSLTETKRLTIEELLVHEL